ETTTNGVDRRPRLHAVQVGEDQAESYPAQAQHRVVLLPSGHLVRHVPELVDGPPGPDPSERFLLQLETGRQELVEGRVEEPDDDGDAVHRLEDRLEAIDLLGLQLLEGTVSLDRSPGVEDPR